MDKIEKKDLTVEILDDLVYEVADSFALNANNGGVRDQLHFLTVVGGWSEEQVLAYINKV